MKTWCFMSVTYGIEILGPFFRCFCFLSPSLLLATLQVSSQWQRLALTVCDGSEVQVMVADKTACGFLSKLLRKDLLHFEPVAKEISEERQQAQEAAAALTGQDKLDAEKLLRVEADLALYRVLTLKKGERLLFHHGPSSQQVDPCTKWEGSVWGYNVRLIVVEGVGLCLLMGCHQDNKIEPDKILCYLSSCA